MATTVTPGASIAPEPKRATPKPAPKPAGQKLQPSTIQASPGESTSPQSAVQEKPIIPKTTPTLPEGVPQGYKPIRQTLNERNIANERIGFDNDGYVTIDNVRGVKPQYNIDGVTYADEATINQLTQDAYTRNGTPLVATRDYATSRGYSDIVDWDGTNPTIGGVATPATYITDDGVSYIPQSEADRLIDDYKTKNEIDGNRKVVEDTEQKYDPATEAAVAKILERDEFSYNKDTDPVYQAYADEYKRNAEEAMRRILNDNNTSVAGASGAVLSEAMAAQNAELQKLNDKVPELYEDAYNRYLNEDSLKRDDLDMIQGLADTYYKRHYTANRDQINDSNAAMDSERQEKQQQFENAIATEENLRNRESHGLDMQNKRLSNQITTEDYDKLIFDNTISKALQQGFFTEADEAVLPWLKYYRNPDATTPKDKYTLHPANAEAEYNRIISDSEYASRGAALRAYGRDAL